MFCPIHASTSGRISLDCSAGPPARIAIRTKPAASSAVAISG
jgi:hypothetical protein